MKRPCSYCRRAATTRPSHQINVYKKQENLYLANSLWGVALYTPYRRVQYTHGWSNKPFLIHIHTRVHIYFLPPHIHLSANVLHHGAKRITRFVLYTRKILHPFIEKKNIYIGDHVYMLDNMCKRANIYICGSIKLRVKGCLNSITTTLKSRVHTEDMWSETHVYLWCYTPLVKICYLNFLTLNQYTDITTTCIAPQIQFLWDVSVHMISHKDICVSVAWLDARPLYAVVFVVSHRWAFRHLSTKRVWIIFTPPPHEQATSQ